MIDSVSANSPNVINNNAQKGIQETRHEKKLSPNVS
jgi:hypothetical protein